MLGLACHGGSASLNAGGLTLFDKTRMNMNLQSVSAGGTARTGQSFGLFRVWSIKYM